MPTKEEIEKVTKAGTTAPTGMGMQSPLIVVVKNKTLRDELAKMNADQKHQYEMEKLQKENAELKRSALRMELGKTATGLLKDL